MSACPPFIFQDMNKAAKLVSSAVVGADFEVIEVNGTSYVVKPPTINRIAGAVSRLSRLALHDGATLKDILSVQENAREYAMALSYLIQENYDLADELSKGSFDEVVTGLATAIDMISAKSFSIAASLTKNASVLVAKPLRW